jgi:hypothetical protein
MFRFSYEINGLKIRIVVKSSEVFLQKLDELYRLIIAGKATNITFY